MFLLYFDCFVCVKFYYTGLDAGITVNTDSFTLNGNAYTNGVFSTTAQYPNINGTVTDADDITDVDNTEEETEDVFDVNKDMILIHTKLTSKYFTEGCDTYDEDYTYSDMNVNINDPIYVTGRLNLDGNISLNNAVGAISDVDLSGGNLNGNNAVIYSKFGDIDISNTQASVNGLIYAPFGTVTIDCDNFNLNGLIIAQNVVIDGGGVNINYNSSWAEFVGTESEELNWTMDDWQYLADTDEDGLPNLIEKEIGSDPYNPDTDGDGLPDGYEALTLGTDPTKPDTDDNGVLDCDEDFDEDGLTNLQEYELGTEPYNDDTDGDGLNDGEEINTYITDPLKVDTDDDGLEDNEEVDVELTKVEIPGKQGNPSTFKYYHHMNSDPSKADTDGDGTVDSSDLNPLVYSFVPYLDILCEYAQNYCSDNNLRNKDDEITLVLEFLRSTKYIGTKWNITAGNINENFIAYVKDNNIDVYNYFLGDDNAVEELFDPLTNEKYDLKHLAATMNAYFEKNDIKSIYSTYYGSMNDMAGWAGDLQQAKIF